jgi:itaconate CoA-transferase
VRDQGETIFKVAMGSAVNLGVECRMADYVNDPRIIGENGNAVSVNAMIECNLMGQVNAEFPHHTSVQCGLWPARFRARRL